MDIPVKNQNGETVETIQLDDAVFNVPMNHPLVHQALVIYQLNKRQGTHNTKTRAQVSGGGRKPWIQKHTGRARQGSIRSPQWRHGGVVFGPHPRDYRKAIPRRMRRLALKCVLSDKARQHRLICLDSVDAVDGKTKSMAGLLQKLDVSGSALMVTQDTDVNVVRASHNLAKVWTLPVTQLNAHELLRRETVIMTVAAARWAEEFLSADIRRHQRTQLAEPAGVVDEVEAAVEEAASELEAAEGLASEAEDVAVEQPTSEDAAPQDVGIEDVVSETEDTVAAPDVDQDTTGDEPASEDVTADTETPDVPVEQDADAADKEEE